MRTTRQGMAVWVSGGIFALTTSSILAAPRLARQFAVVDSEGSRIVNLFEDGEPAEAPTLFPRIGNLFTYNHVSSTPESVSFGELDYLWVGQEVNVERLQTFSVFGDGLPAWEHSYEIPNPPFVATAAAEGADFALSLFNPGGLVQVEGFDSTSSAPRWTYTFDAPYNWILHTCVDVSRDGSVACAVASDQVGLQSRIIVFNQGDGSELARFDKPYTASAIFLSADGTRGLLTTGATGRMLNMADGSEIFVATASGSGGIHRMSADGKVFAVGGFNLRIQREIDGAFQEVFVQQNLNQWYGYAIAFSADGHYAIAASHNFFNYTTLTYRIIDVFAQVELARTTTTGAGPYQDSLAAAAVNDAGTVFATASWGLLNNDHPEVQLFNRAAEIIGGIDTPGSVFALDITKDGRIVASGSKSIHANLPGSGGDVTVYEAFDAPVGCDGDANGDQVVDPLDSGYVLSRFGCPVATGDALCDAADVNLDGLVDPLDAGYVLSRFGGCD